MIDLHAHILPGIDDGPRDMEGALALAERAAAQGVRTLTATPHLRHDFPAVDVERTAAACAALQARIPAEWDLRIYCGGEVDLAWALGADTQALRLASFRQRGTDLLVETPYGELGRGFEIGLAELSSRGYRLLIAHPEMNRSLQRDPDRIARLVADGVLVQVTASSLLRKERRSGPGKLARRLVRRELAHVIASDAHSSADWRPPRLREGLDAARALAPDRAGWMVTVAPAAILAGKPLPPIP